MGTAESRNLSLSIDSMGGLHWLGIVAALVTAVVHLQLGVRFAPNPLGISFLLAGLGFLGAVVLVLLDYRRRTVYAVGIPFTAVQILLWYGLNFGMSFPPDVGTFGVVDKLAQIVLIGVLVALLR